MYRNFSLFIFVLTCSFIFSCSSVFAQGPLNPTDKPSDISLAYAGKIANTCLGNWKNQSCLKIISESNLVMAANYVELLEEKGKQKEADKILEDCAAATAATKGNYPAYAMNSAFAECANTMATTFENTSIVPDASQFQLLFVAIKCLSGDQLCPILEMGLQLYK